MSALPLILLILWGGSFLLAVAQTQTQAQDRWEEDFKPDPAQGERIFAARCGSCHGMDGRGAERAPNIAGSAKLQNLSDAAISAIVSNGIPGTGMPAFRSLSPAEVRDVVSHLRALQGKSEAPNFPGDSSRGKAVFFGKGDCSSCHMVEGKGGFMGPDLSAYGSNVSAKEIVEAITKAREIGAGSRAAEAVTRDGRRVVGAVRNEDNFSVQIQTADGDFHFFQRSELQSLEYQDHPIMPANYGERLTREQLDDLTSYLMSVGRSSKTDRSARSED